jgi:hypothetical protein
MELSLKCKTCPCLLRASPISPLALITSVIGSNDSNRVSTPPPHFFCYLAVGSPLFRVSVVRVQTEPVNGAPPLFIYPQLLVYHTGGYRPYSQVVCTADSMTPPSSRGVSTTAWRLRQIVVWWFWFGEAPSVGRATNTTWLLSVYCCMLGRHLAVGYHRIYFVLKYYLQLV